MRGDESVEVYREEEAGYEKAQKSVFSPSNALRFATPCVKKHDTCLTSNG